MSEPSPPREVVDFQLAVLKAYEKLLANCNWDEARLNEVFKAALSSLLPLLRAQRALGEQLFASHKELIEQYRRTLEAALDQRDAPPGGKSSGEAGGPPAGSG